MDEEELMAVMGHELGHVKAGHVPIEALQGSLRRSANIF